MLLRTSNERKFSVDGGNREEILQISANSGINYILQVTGWPDFPPSTFHQHISGYAMKWLTTVTTNKVMDSSGEPGFKKLWTTCGTRRYFNGLF